MTGINRSLLSFSLLLILLIARSSAAPLQFRISDLGLFPGGTAMSPSAINNKGDIVGEGTTSNGVYRPFLYRDGVTTELNMGEGFGYALDINDAGYIVGQGLVEGRLHCFLVTPTATIDLNEQTGFDLWPQSLNQAGEVVGYIPAATEAFVWSNGVVRLLGKLHPDYLSSAFDINNRGVVVGTAYAPNDVIPGAPLNFAVLFQDGGIVNLGGSFSTGAALNDQGEVVGSTIIDPFGYRAFLYHGDGGPLIDLGTLPGDFKSYASDINNLGHVIGISEGAGERTRPFLYQDGVMHDLNDLLKPHSGWDLFHAAAINDRGEIVGVGYHDGLERPYLLTPIKPVKPEKPGKARESH
jgi:probable HAF family extracellular repeat protein